MSIKTVRELRDELTSTMHIFIGDEFSEEHISELLELIEPIYEKAWRYEGLEK